MPNVLKHVEATYNVFSYDAESLFSSETSLLCGVFKKAVREAIRVEGLSWCIFSPLIGTVRFRTDFVDRLSTQ
jgi:hypothetical protein